MTDSTRYSVVEASLLPANFPWHEKMAQVVLATAYDALVQRVTELEAALGQRGIRDVAFKLSEEAQQKMDDLEAKLAQAEARVKELETELDSLTFAFKEYRLYAKPAEEERGHE